VFTASGHAPDRDLSAATIVLIHGAGSGPWVFNDWRSHFRHQTVEAVDLQANLNVNDASMADYACSVVTAAQRLPQPVSLCGWSMGGLVALQASRVLRLQSLILIEPSPPAQIQGFHPNIDLAAGSFDPEQEYGSFPDGYRARPESSRARTDRKRGISVPRVSCPVLVIYGRAFPVDRGQSVARLYDGVERYFPDLDHWGLVRDPRVPELVAHYVNAPTTISDV